MNILLPRSEFRLTVFNRDHKKCVICGETVNLDAHHIIERRLFDDGGYYCNNGVTLCSKHHIDAEKTIISVEDLRLKAGITNIVIPPHMYTDQIYDKWGNIILPNGQRMIGELFYDESVQNILKDVIHLFTPYVKYPRTFHAPFSQGVSSDDRILESTEHFYGKEVVVTLKIDGENFTVYPDGFSHARSIDSTNHPSRNWAKNRAAQFAYDIPKGWRAVCENVFAEHTIHYKNLSTYLFLISIWDDHNISLSWDNTLEWAELLGIETVPILYRGIYDENLIKSLHHTYNTDGNRMEGYVVRITESFTYKDFRRSVMKFVDGDFKQDVNESAHGHWLRKHRVKVITNDLI